MSSVNPASVTKAVTAKGEATAAALLTATISCLVERGHAGTTTAEISRRAGVSPGLFVRYFPTKGALLAAAAGYAHRRSLADFEERWDRAAEGATDDRARVRIAIRLIIDLYCEPEMRCLAELAAAARTDPELAASVAEVTASIDSLLVRSSHRLAPAGMEGADPDRYVRLVVDCARGVAQRTTLVDERLADAARAETSDALAQLFGLTESG